LAMEKMPNPPGLEISQSGSAVIIRRPWLNWTALLVIPYFAFLLWLILDSSQSQRPAETALTVILIAWVSYFALGSLFNTTKVTIRASSVDCVTRPFPLSLDCHVTGENIRDVVVQMRARDIGFVSCAVSYAVMYVDAEKKRRMLVARNARKEQAEFIAESIRQILGVGEAAT
jgi:hypothetical protein